VEGYVAFAQGLYFFLTGVWPIIDIVSFQKVTGPKTDLWLVKTVGVIVAVIGAVLILAGATGEITYSIRLLALGSAAGLATIDVIYVTKRVISPIYLLDALLELAIIILWVGGISTL
jgi:hypothetical protein